MIITQEEENYNNYMSDDSSSPSNDLENQVLRKMIKEDIWSKTIKLGIHFAGADKRVEETTEPLICKKKLSAQVKLWK